MTDEEFRKRLDRIEDQVRSLCVSVDALRGEHQAKYASLSGRTAVLETRNAVDEVHRLNVEKRLTGIEDLLKWVVRLILGALLLALLGFMFSGGLNVSS